MRTRSLTALAAALALTLAAAASAAPRRTVPSQLARLYAAGAIDQPTYDADRVAYRDTRRVRSRLRGERRAELSAVIGDLDSIAAGGLLTASRLPSLFETLARNRQWWTTRPLLAVGARVTFPGSGIVWQHYAGQGLQIQWLGTFGKANALFHSGDHDAELGALLDEAVPLAAQRAGGIAFEYLFPFDGGRPPWASGLAQATGIQALSRAAVRLGRPQYFEDARAALGIFQAPPPSGVRIATPVGAHYLIYSFAPQMRVLNAFTQALNGLHDFALLANDPIGRALFAAGDRELRTELPAYDTGAWSRYSLHTEANLSYHTLARDFLRGLCQREQEDLSRPNGGTSPGADPTPYCAMADRFTAYLTAPPVLTLVSRRVRAGRPAAVRLTVSKPAYVTLTVRHLGTAVGRAGAQFASGVHALRWNRPHRAGPYRIVLRATDLAGNRGVATGTLHVLGPK